MKEVYLENCEGFTFIEWQPAYCSWCKKSIKYSIKKWKAIIPNQCSNCFCNIYLNKKDNHKGLILISSNSKIEDETKNKTDIY